MEGVGGLRYPGCSHGDVPLSVQVGGSMCVYRPAIAAITIKHRVTMPQSPLYLDIYVSTQSPLYLDIYVSTQYLQSSSRQASDKERCGQAAASCPVASVPITMQTIAHHTTPPHHCRHHHFDPTQVSIYLTHIVATTSPLSHTYLHIYISTISAHPHARSQPRVVAQIRILDT